MAAPGFGFSFGDFVQAIGLLNDVRKALRDTGGAKDEFRHVSVDLHHLEILLEQLAYGNWDHGGDTGHLNAVKGMALTCKVPLQEFLTKVKKYRSLQNEELRCFGLKIMSEARKVQWAVKMRDEVEKFRAVIVAKIVVINMLLQLHMVSKISKVEIGIAKIENSSTALETHMVESQAATSRMVYEMREAAAAQAMVGKGISHLVQICTGTRASVVKLRELSELQHTETKHQLGRIEHQQKQGYLMIFWASREVLSCITGVESVLKQLLHVFGGFSVAILTIMKSILQKDLEIYALLCQIQSSISRGPMLSVEDCIHFTDALGRKSELQYQWFKHWDVFQSMLNCEFKKLPGEQRVLKGQFCILNARRKGHVISPEQWDRSVFPGSVITMSIIIIGSLFKRGFCPRPDCGAENLMPLDSSTLIICSACQLKYYRVDGTLLSALPRLKIDHRPARRASNGRKVGFKTGSALVSEIHTSYTSEPWQDDAKEGQSTDNDASHDYSSELDVLKAIHIQTKPLGESAMFSPRIRTHATWSSREYDRRGGLITSSILTPMLAQQIKEELNTFKMEMEVHETSKIYTHFF